MKRILHIVNKSRLEHNALNSCLRILGAGDALLLIENGVYNALNTAENRQVLSETGIPVYVLAPDLQARGYTEQDVLGHIAGIDYGEFVELTVDYESSQSW